LVSTQEHIQRLIAIRLQAFFGPTGLQERVEIGGKHQGEAHFFRFFPYVSSIFDKSSLTISNSLTVSDL
jgi:hypothetical protein